ncbi:hypothetical protein HYT52_05105 [Candidatus Woesearchaeota archaeon]|nr:hypothetical protein [Candidatus Woesearchaeota archaeon]
MMDTGALETFRLIFSRHDTGGRKQPVVLKNGGVLTISGPHSEVTAMISLPKGATFQVRKVGDFVEVRGGENCVQLTEFNVYLGKNKYKMAPNGWVITTQHECMVTLKIL